MKDGEATDEQNDSLKRTLAQGGTAAGDLTDMAITSIHLNPSFSRAHLSALIRYLTMPNALTSGERQMLL